MVTLHYPGVGSFASQAILSDIAKPDHFARRYRDAIAYLVASTRSAAGQEEAHNRAAINLISGVFALPPRAVMDATNYARSSAPKRPQGALGPQPLLRSNAPSLNTETDVVSDLALYTRAIAFLAEQQCGIASWSQQIVAPKELSLVALFLTISPRIVFRDATALQRLLEAKRQRPTYDTNRLAA